MQLFSDKNSKKQPFVWLFTGIIFAAIVSSLLVVIYYSYISAEASNDLKYITHTGAFTIVFGLGCLMPTLRDSGFRYYMEVRKKRLEGIKKAKETGLMPPKYPGKWQNFLFQTFRNGSVAEECIAAFKNREKPDESHYLFLDDCKNAQDAVDKHRIYAVEINKRLPMIFIYQSYRQSETFQYLDTGFCSFRVYWYCRHR